MKKLVGLLVVLGTSACLRPVRTPTIERPDPHVGDMRCAPAMHVSDLLETLHSPMPPTATCESE